MSPEITIERLAQISAPCESITSGSVYRAVFYGFFRLSNLTPHALVDFDFSRHLTGEDMFFTKKFVKVLLKWTLTTHTRDKIQCITLPKLQNKLICPYIALKGLFKLCLQIHPYFKLVVAGVLSH